jgi:hypothetical protein
VLAALPLHAQEEEPCAFVPDQPVIQWTGTISGCSNEGGPACVAGETILFRAVPRNGGTYPACVVYNWTFSDGEPGFGPAPEHVFAEDGPIFARVDLDVPNGKVGDEKSLLLNPAPTTIVPIINVFAAAHSAVARGGVITLQWSTRNANKFRLDPPGSTLPQYVTSYSFAPPHDGVYTFKLTAYGVNSLTESRSVTVEVGTLRRRSVRSFGVD